MQAANYARGEVFISDLKLKTFVFINFPKRFVFASNWPMLFFLDVSICSESFGIRIRKKYVCDKFKPLVDF